MQYSDRHVQDFAAAVRRDLALEPKQLESKYLYDALGSCLFEAICRLPSYQITRAENRLLERHAATVAGTFPDLSTIIELGCGSGEKLAMIAHAVTRRGRGAQVHLIDISRHALETSERLLNGLEQVSVVGHRATYEAGLRMAAAQRATEGALAVLFLGSNIGNFDPDPAAEFLRAIRAPLRSRDALLLGADLVKPERELLLAYDDPLGVTAAFNLNLLLRINRELGGDFDLQQFKHRAVWNGLASRVEMHLVSRRRQVVRIPAADSVVTFADGESIWTESSYKFQVEQIVEMVRRAGFRLCAQWIDSAAAFLLGLFEAE